MPHHYVHQYQVKTEPVSTTGEIIFESKWHYPWSTPVRTKIDPRLAVALATAGPRLAPFPQVSFSYFEGLSEPKRFKPGLRPDLQQFFTISALPVPPANTLIQWYARLSEPVRKKPGLGAPLQDFFAYPPRLLPNPNVTAIMLATETNNDEFTGAINVYAAVPQPTSGAGARVSIQEIVVPLNNPVSIRES